MRLGHEQPRLFTPPLRPLTPETSLGFAAIEFADTMLEDVDLFPWQRWLLIHALELNPDGSFRFRTIVLLVARQNGKSLVLQVLSLFFLYVLGIAMMIGTAQDLGVAEKQWKETIGLAEEVEELEAEIAKVNKTNGKHALTLKSGGEYWVRAANRKGGRGLTSDLILLDELREHQNWLAWAAITKTANARPNAQIWTASNAGDSTSVVLRHLRMLAHVALGDPDGDYKDEALAAAEAGEGADPKTLRVGLFEWSAEPGCDRWDRDGWAQANPSLGHIDMEGTIAGDAATDPEWVFRTEVLCQWPGTVLAGPFPTGAWEAGIDPTSTVPDDAPLTFCLDVSWDKTMTYLAWAGLRTDGNPHAEVTVARAGTDWVVPYFKARATPANPMTVVIQGRGCPASVLIEDLEAVDHVTVLRWQGEDLGNGTGRLWHLVKAWIPDEDPGQIDTDKLGTLTALPGARTGDGDVPRETRRLFHMPQDLLNVAAANAAVKMSADGAMLWDRSRSPVDIAPLVAITGAVWGALQHEPTQQRSAYDEGASLMVLD